MPSNSLLYAASLSSFIFFLLLHVSGSTTTIMIDVRKTPPTPPQLLSSLAQVGKLILPSMYQNQSCRQSGWFSIQRLYCNPKRTSSDCSPQASAPASLKKLCTASQIGAKKPDNESVTDNGIEEIREQLLDHLHSVADKIKVMHPERGGIGDNAMAHGISRQGGCPTRL